MRCDESCGLSAWKYWLQTITLYHISAPKYRLHKGHKLHKIITNRRSKGKNNNNFSLDGKTPGRSHLRRGDHIYPRAITSCPGHALCLTWQVKCTCPGDHILACCNVLHCIATPGTRHECDHRGMYIQLARSGTVHALGKMWSPGGKCDRPGVDVISLAFNRLDCIKLCDMDMCRVCVLCLMCECICSVSYSYWMYDGSNVYVLYEMYDVWCVRHVCWV